MDISSKVAGLSALMVFSFAAVATGGLGDITQNIGLDNQPVAEASQNEKLTDNIESGYNIVAYKNGEKVTKTHNVLMEGEEAVEQAIGQGAGNTYDTIAVGNGNAPTDTSNVLDSEYSSCGLSPQTSTQYEDNGGGAWNYTVTYDVSCDDIVVNTTAIKSTTASTDYDYFAGADLGRDINAYSGDSITIEWSHNVTNP